MTSSHVQIDWRFINDPNGIPLDSLGAGSGGNTKSYNVKSAPYNAKGDGVTDDTAAIQQAMNDCAANRDGFVQFTGDTFMINAVTSLNIPSNIRIVFHPKTVLKAITTSANTYNILNLNNVSNVFIEGNGAIVQGERDTHSSFPLWQANHTYALNDTVNANGIVLKCTTAGTSSATMPTGQGTTVNDGTVVWAYQYAGENGMGVYIVSGCYNIFISNLTAKNCWGDGFYVGGGTPCENIFLTNCIGDGNRRQGLSITNVKNMLVLFGEYKNTFGTNPQFGIDVEPNSGCIIENVNIITPFTKNNYGGGIQLVPTAMSGSTNPFNVNIKNFTSDSDLSDGIDFIGGSPPMANEVYGQVTLEGATIINPMANGVYFQCWRNAPRAWVKDVTVINPNAENSATPQVASGIVVYASPSDSAGNYGNIKFENCGTIDNRGTSQTYAAFFMASDATHNIQNIAIIDPFWEGLKTTLKGYIDSTGNFFGNAKFTVPSIVSISTSQSIYAYLGQEINATATLTATLPLSNGAIGNEFTVRYGAASGTVTIAAQSGDTIIHKGTSVTTLALTVAGTYAKVRAIGANKYIVVEHNIS